MKFIRKALSPANKRQYLLALGRKDIELLLGEAINAARYTPTTMAAKDDKRRLRSIAAALGEALEVAKEDGDDYARVPVERRQEYKDALDNENPLLNITRLELIDHRPRPDGTVKGRTVVFFDPSTKVESSIQDGGRTMKLFIDKREPHEMLDLEESSRIAEDSVDALMYGLAQALGVDLDAYLKTRNK